MTGTFRLATFDLATTVGWACGAPSQRPMWGHERMAPTGSGPGTVALNSMGWLDHKIGDLKPSHVFAEDQYLGGNRINPDVLRRLYGLRFMCEAMCEKHGASLTWVPIATVTKFFTGLARWPKGEKKQATMRICALYGWAVSDDNEADALALFLYGEHQLLPAAARTRSMGPLYIQR